MMTLTNVLLSIIALFTIMNWMEHSHRWLNGKKRYGKYKHKVIKYIMKVK